MAETGLKGKDRLTKLSLEGNNIGSAGLIAISVALTGNNELQELFLYNNNIDDSAMENFSKFLKNKINLHTLGLEFNKIGGQGASFIFMSFKDLPLLEKLYLSSN